MRITKTEVTVDIVVEQEGKVLLIKRGKKPFAGKWALPGGFVETDEKVITAAIRELAEETAMEVEQDDLQFIGYFDDPKRDPRGRLISFAFGVKLSKDLQPKAGDDASEASWFSLDNLPELAFDHAEILEAWRMMDA